MKLVLKEFLSKILTLKPTYEYVGNYGSNVFNGTWTATDNGIAVVRAGWNTSGAFAYWYISDITDNRYMCCLGGNANGTSLTASFPVIKGHQYGSSAMSSVYYADLFFYKTKLVGGVVRKLLKAFKPLTLGRGWAA